MVQVFLTGDAVMGSTAIVAGAAMKFLALFLLILSQLLSLSGWLIWRDTDFFFKIEELWDNKQWMEVVFLNDHQAKTEAAVVCDLPVVPVPSEA